MRFVKHALTRENFRSVLDPLIGRGDFLFNLSVDVSSIALIKLCWEKGSMYLDTCIEPWAGGYTDPTISPSRRTNYALREEALALRDTRKRAPTAVLTHGANPGLVSHFVKQALLNIAADTGVEHGEPGDARDDWARARAQARREGDPHRRARHADLEPSRRSRTSSSTPGRWTASSAKAASRPSSAGARTRRISRATASATTSAAAAAIYLMQPGAATRVRTWTPKAGPFHGFLITHGEAISIADYLTVQEGRTGACIARPCTTRITRSDAAVLSVHELAGRNWHMQDRKRILMDEIVKGMDELGVLLAGHKKNAYWYGSQLSIQEARKLAPHNSATSLQVTVSALAGMIWAMENPNSGLVEPDEIDYKRILEICRPYLGHGGGRVHRLASAGGSRPAVSRRPGRNGSLAVQERPRDLTSSPLPLAGEVAHARVRALRLSRLRERSLAARVRAATHDRFNAFRLVFLQRRALPYRTAAAVDRALSLHDVPPRAGCGIRHLGWRG